MQQERGGACLTNKDVRGGLSGLFHLASGSRPRQCLRAFRERTDLDFRKVGLGRGLRWRTRSRAMSENAVAQSATQSVPPWCSHRTTPPSCQSLERHYLPEPRVASDCREKCGPRCPSAKAGLERVAKRWPAWEIFQAPVDECYRRRPQPSATGGRRAMSRTCVFCQLHYRGRILR